LNYSKKFNLFEQEINMKHNYFLGLVLGGLLTSSGVQAQDPINKLGDSGLYGEVGYIPLTVRFENGAFIKPELVNLKIGVTFNENLSLEGIAATTVKENRGASVDMIGMFLKPKISLTERTEVFALTGLTHLRAGGTAYGSSTRGSFGAGIQTKFNEHQYLQLNYLRYATGKGREVVQGFNLSLGTSF
jgi:hypothetical protein